MIPDESLQECVTCKERKPRSSFSITQLKNRSNQRKCKHCIDFQWEGAIRVVQLEDEELPVQSQPLRVRSRTREPKRRRRQRHTRASTSRSPCSTDTRQSKGSRLSALRLRRRSTPMSSRARHAALDSTLLRLPLRHHSAKLLAGVQHTLDADLLRVSPRRGITDRTSSHEALCRSPQESSTGSEDSTRIHPPDRIESGSPERGKHILKVQAPSPASHETSVRDLWLAAARPKSAPGPKAVKQKDLEQLLHFLCTERKCEVDAIIERIAQLEEGTAIAELVEEMMRGRLSIQRLSRCEAGSVAKKLMQKCRKQLDDSVEMHKRKRQPAQVPPRKDRRGWEDPEGDWRGELRAWSPERRAEQAKRRAEAEEKLQKLQVKEELQEERKTHLGKFAHRQEESRRMRIKKLRQDQGQRAEEMPAGTEISTSRVDESSTDISKVSPRPPQISNPSRKLLRPKRLAKARRVPLPSSPRTLTPASGTAPNESSPAHGLSDNEIPDEALPVSSPVHMSVTEIPADEDTPMESSGDHEMLNQDSAPDSPAYIPDIDEDIEDDLVQDMWSSYYEDRDKEAAGAEIQLEQRTPASDGDGSTPILHECYETVQSATDLLKHPPAEVLSLLLLLKLDASDANTHADYWRDGAWDVEALREDVEGLQEEVRRLHEESQHDGQINTEPAHPRSQALESEQGCADEGEDGCDDEEEEVIEIVDDDPCSDNQADDPEEPDVDPDGILSPCFLELQASLEASFGPQGASIAAVENSKEVETDSEFKKGSKVQYWSWRMQKWITAQILCENDDGTFDLNVKRFIKPQYLRPVNDMNQKRRYDPPIGEPPVVTPRKVVHTVGHDCEMQPIDMPQAKSPETEYPIFDSLQPKRLFIPLTDLGTAADSPRSSSPAGRLSRALADPYLS